MKVISVFDPSVRKAIHSEAHRALCASLRDRRIELGLRQADLAEQLDISSSFVSQLELADRRIDLTELAQVCEVLKIDLQDAIDVFRRVHDGEGTGELAGDASPRARPRRVRLPASKGRAKKS